MVPGGKGALSSERPLRPRAAAEARNCCHSTVVLVQPITASIQRARVPPWEFSDCPGSHIRRARGATLGRESPEVQVPGGPAPLGSRSVGPGVRAILGAAALSESLQRRDGLPPRAPFGGCSWPTVGIGSAEPVRTGRRPVSAGKESDTSTRRALRRRGSGTKERIDVSKWGRSGAQPRPDRMARIRRITAKREVAERAPDWRLRPYER